MTLNDYFDKIYCINLEKRKDRRDEMVKTFYRLSIDVEIIEAIEGNKEGWKSDKYPHPMRGFEGVAGGTSTQISLIRQTAKEGLRSVLMFEDDCEFIDFFNLIFDEIVKSIPKDWDMIYLGGLNDYNKGVPVEINEDIVKVTGMMSTHAYALKNTVFKKAIEIVNENYPYLTDSADGFLCTLQKECNAYAFNPPLVWQKADYSDIQHGYRDYVDQFKKRLI